MTANAWCVYALLMIQSAELIPTTKSNDDLPTQEGNDYRLKNGYTNNQQETRTTHTTAKKMGRSNVQTDSRRTISDESDAKITKARAADTDAFPQTNSQKTTQKEPTMTNTKMKLSKALRNLKANRVPKERIYRWTVREEDMGPFLPAYIEYGLNTWARVSQVLFQYVPFKENIEDDDVDIFISFKSGAHDGCERPFTDTSSPGHVIFPDDLEDIIEIHLDRDKDWQYATDIVDIGAMERPENPPDLIGEVIHQAGHVLQFVHSTNEQSFMHRPLPAKDMKYAPHYILDHEDKKVVKTSLGKCSPPRIDAIFSFFIGNGRSYIIIGPYTYQLQEFRNERNETYASIYELFPRPSIYFWNNFEFIDEAFIHTDGNTYFFSGDEYAVHLSNQRKTKIAYKMKLGHGSTIDSSYIGWPGLDHYRYIDAIFRNSTSLQTYIIQDDLVYLWNDTATVSENNNYHLPKGAVADGWPRKISEIFPGVPNNIDTAFHFYFDDKIYFFKDQFYYVWLPEKGFAKRRRIDNMFKNICNVYMCFNGSKPNKACTAWGMRRRYKPL